MNVLGQLRSMNAKMTARSYVLPPNSMGNSMPLGAVALKVTDVIKDVKDIFPDTFSNDVYVTGLQTVRKPAKGKDFTPGLLFSRVNVDTDTETPVGTEIKRTTATSGTATVVEGGVRLGNGEIVPPPAGMSAEEFAGKLNGLAERIKMFRAASREGAVAEISDYLKGEQTESTGQKNTPSETGDVNTVFADDSGVSLYTAYDESGKPVTVVTTGQDVFAGVGKNKYANIAQKIIKEKFRGKTLPLGENDLARITGNSAGEYGYPAKRGGITPEEYNAKMKAATELDSLLENSEYVRWARDNQNHRHKEAELGWDYYRTVFVVDGKAFEGIINIANSENGRMFYDMTDVKEIPGTYGEYVARLARSSPVSGNLYGNTIAQTESSVKGSMRNVDPDTTGAASTVTVVDGGVRLGNIVNPGRNAMIYVTAYQDKKSNNIIAAFDLNNNLYGEIAHKCTSIYGRESIASLIKSLPDNAAFYVKNTSDNAMSGNGILRSPKLLLPVESVVDTIAQATKNFNTENASSIGVDADTETPVGTEIQRTQEQEWTSQEPLQDTGITDNRFTEALEKIGVTNITGSLADYGNVRSEQNMARAARDAKKYLKKVLKETNADEKTRTFARDMARGLYTEQDIPASMSRDKVKAIADACIDLLTQHQVKLLCIRDRLLFDKQGATCF